MKTIRIAFVLLWIAASGCAGPDSTYVSDVDAWHAARVARLQSDTGVLTQVGLHPLERGSQSLGSAPDADIVLTAAAPPNLGVITVGDDAVTFTADADVTVEIFGQVPAEHVQTAVLAGDASGSTTVLSSGLLLLHVIERGGEPFLRVRDRNSPAPRDFAGVDRYPVSERWRVTAELIQEGDGSLSMPNVLGQMTTSDSPGTLTFELDGVALRLRPTTYPDGRLFLVFADATTGTETYAGGRFLVADPVGSEGRVVLDFNRAYNPVCAFNAYSSCPLPTAGNTLPIAVRAGEKRPD